LAVRAAVCSVCFLVAALVTSSAAPAHVVPEPQALPTGAVTTMSFAVPNERREPMSGVTVSVPADVRIVHTYPTAGWTAAFDRSSARWRGGPLAYLGLETFRLDVDVSAAPGPVTLKTRELYPSGAVVDWPATLTVVPGPEDEQPDPVGWGWIAAIAGVGLVFITGLAVLAWDRRGRAT
jgi:Domain of unkown function (DUF1775)